jgi:hypothetical protein
MATHSVVVVIGKRKTGKTVLIRDLLYHKQNIPLGLVMSHTDHLTHFYDQFIPSMLIHKDYDSEQVGKLFQRQTKALQENWKEPSAFLLLDDVLSDKAWKSCSNLKEVFFNGRHYKLLFILGMQSPMGIGPDLRNNIDYTFIFKNNLQSERRKIYDNYAGVFKTFEIFNHVLESTTEDYNCLAIVDNSLSNKLEDKVFYYNVYNVYALLIQKGCWNWLNKIECKDRTYGIRPRLDLTKSELFGDLRYPNHAYNQF